MPDTGHSVGHLVPVWIVYVDGERLDPMYEGTLERIVVDDQLDVVGSAVLEFDSSKIKIRDSGTFSLESYVSVHLGYKDDCEQVFAGEVTEFKGDFSEYGHERVKVVCKNCLHKLQNALQSLSFEAKSPAAVLKERLGVYGLKGEIEDFGAVRNYFVESGLSDYEYLLQTARKYGKTVYGYEDTVYIKDEVTVSNEEVILEWGKSLISFRCSENLKEQLSGCTFAGWDENNCEGITGSAGLSDIPVKVGGGKTWEDNSKGASGTWKTVFMADDLYDNEDAKNRAIGYLQNISMEYQTGVGKCEGNRHVFPGMRVTIKYVGEHFSGEYIAERVVHEVSVNGPFTTEVYVKRNMTAGGASHVPGAELAEQECAGNTETEQAAVEEGDEHAALYENEADDTAADTEQPAITQLLWKKDTSAISKALIGDTVLLCAEVRNIPDGTDAVIRIAEQDDDGTNDAVAVLTAAVSNGRILCAWDVVYTADNDDSSSVQELQEKGYTVPEYVFTVECGGVKSGKSPLLEVMGWIRTAFRNNKTGKPLVNRKYRIYLYDGTIITGKTDNNGYVDIKTLKQGQYFILMER